MAFVAQAGLLGFKSIVLLLPGTFLNACCLQLLLILSCPGDHLSPAFSSLFFSLCAQVSPAEEFP